MIYYFVSLALGLMAIYALRDGLLALQNHRDAKLLKQSANKEVHISSNIIITQNYDQCKRFDKVS